jgi:hypothetical protein
MNTKLNTTLLINIKLHYKNEINKKIMNTKQLNRIRSCSYRNKNLKITKETRDIIHGYVMSDGYLRDKGNLTVDQNIKQKKFVEWLFEKFKNIRTETPISQVPRTDKRKNTQTFSLRFNTKNLLHGFHSMWYKPTDPKSQTITYKKSLPKSINCFFSPVFIAVWFAGNGTKIIGSKGAKFEVTNYSPEDRQKLKKLFKQKYDISACINRAGVSTTGTEQWSISINSDDYDKFKTLITKIDLISTLFPYKLH